MFLSSSGPNWPIGFQFRDLRNAAGVDGAEVCCDCMSPTSPHFQEQNCSAKLTTWKDSGGYTCADYELKQWCEDGELGPHWDAQSWGSISDYSNNADGLSAVDVCCECSSSPGIDCIHGIGKVSDEDSEAWSDVNGMTCNDYEALNWCDNGETGDGWNSAWGIELSEFGLVNVDGTFTDASDECCACGALFDECTEKCCVDDPDWVDGYGHKCPEYYIKHW